MKKLSLLVLMFASAMGIANAQTEEYITLGVNGGILNNINGYRMNTNYDGETFENGKLGYNFAIDLGIRTSAKTRFRLEIEHEELHYNAIWHTTPASPAIRIPYETYVKVWNMGINLRFDYKYFETEKIKLFVSPGFLWEFNINRETENHMIHYQDSMSHKYRDCSYKKYPYIGSENPKHIAGGNVQFLCKYKIAKHIAITLTPEYYIYFRGFVKDNYGKPYQRLTMNCGLEFNF